MGNWSNSDDVAVWQFTMPKAGSYRVELDARAVSEAAFGQRVEACVGEKTLVAKIGKDGMHFDGKLDIPAGKQEISIKVPDAKRTGPPIIDLFGITLVLDQK